MKTRLILIVLLTFLFSCAGEPGEDGADGHDATCDIESHIGFPGEDGQDGIDGEDGEDGEDGKDGQDGQDGTDSTSDEPDVHNLSGQFEKGLCWEGGEIRIWPLDDGSLTQLGSHFIGTTGEHGTYNVRAETSEEYVLVYSNLTCDDEVNGGSSEQELQGYRKTSDPFSNINILTKISKPVADYLFDDPFSETYGDVEQSMVESERLTCEYLGMPELEKRFTQMSLRIDSTSDAGLLLVSAVILHNRTPAEQADYTSKISTGIIEDNQILKAEILQSYNNLSLVDIKNKLETSYANAGIGINTPKFWRLLDFPDYYKYLLESEHVVTDIINLEDNATCSFDQSTYNMFAIPFVFGSEVEISKYVAYNFPPDAEISIWTKGIHIDGYIAPDINILDVVTLREIILDNPVKLSYNGMLGEDHGLTAGTEYYIRIRRDENFTLSTGCDGGYLPFGRKLASNDEGLTWLGHNNNSLWFRESGVKGILYF